MAPSAGERFIGGFFLLLFKWQGSVYKSLWKNVLIWLAVFYFIRLFDYFYIVNEDKRDLFVAFCEYCNAWISTIPLGILLALLLGFACLRWWKMWDLLPWPDTVALYVTTTILGQDERSRQMRLTIVRYMNLACVQTMALFIPSFQRRFVKWKDFLDIGLVSDNERAILENVSANEKVQNLYHMPLVWAATIVTKARKESRIDSDVAAYRLLDQIAEYRRRCGTSMHVGLVQVPLMYMQVVSLAVYVYFGTALLGRQYNTTHEGHRVFELYVPFFTVFEMVFYWGWLKTAEALLSPNGSAGDEAQDLDWIIDRHIKTANAIVDDMHGSYPEMVRDYELYCNKPQPISIVVSGGDNPAAGQTQVAADGNRRHSIRKNDSIITSLLNGKVMEPLTSGVNRKLQAFGASLSNPRGQRSKSNSSKDGSGDDERRGSAGNNQDPKGSTTSIRSGLKNAADSVEQRRKRISEPSPAKSRGRLGSFSSMPTLAPSFTILPRRGRRFRNLKLTVMPSVDEVNERRDSQLPEGYTTPDKDEKELKRPGTLPMARRPSRPWVAQLSRSSSSPSDLDDDADENKKHNKSSTFPRIKGADDAATPSSAYVVAAVAGGATDKSAIDGSGAGLTEPNEDAGHPRPSDSGNHLTTSSASGGRRRPMLFRGLSSRDDGGAPSSWSSPLGPSHHAPVVKADSLKVPSPVAARAFFRLGSSVSGSSDYFTYTAISPSCDSDRPSLEFPANNSSDEGSLTLTKV